MKSITYNNAEYISPVTQISLLPKLLPSVCFYAHFFWEIMCAASRAKKGKYDSAAWSVSSLALLHHLEGIGIKIHISTIDNLQNTQGPVVIIGNHMSMMETILLPGIVCPIKPATFVIKESLLNYPVFKHVVRSQYPIAVSRTNPRADLKLVMEEGTKHLEHGTSIIIFPQTTRANTFSAQEMSSIGVKLAKRANVPIIPLALKTDAWSNGTRIKDLGKLNPNKTVHFSFGKPIEIIGKGDEEQLQLCQYIENELKKWQLPI